MIEELLAYQEVDAELKEYEKELAGSEERKKRVTARKFLEGVEETIAKLEANSTELMNAYSNVIEKMKQLKAQASEFDKALDEMQSQDECAYLMRKTEEVAREINALGDELARIEGDMQKTLKEYATLKNKNKEMRAQYEEFNEKYKQLVASKKDVKDNIDGRLQVLREKVDADIMALYDRKRKDEKLFPVLYAIRDNYCGACNMELSMSEINKLKNGEIIVCDNCRRMLYKKD